MYNGSPSLQQNVILDPPRTRRRRPFGRLLWPLVITIGVVTAFALSGAGRDSRAELEYLSQVQDQASALSTKGDALRDVMFRLATIDRTELVTVTEGIQADIASGLETAAAEPPSPTLFAVAALYRQALESWETGVEGLESAVLTAADDPEDTAVADNIANALAELRAGDQLYLRLLSELAREEVPDPAGQMPQVALMPAEGGLVTLSQAYVLAARSPESGLALRPGLGVAQVVSVPEWEMSPDDEVIVPNTDKMTFEVVVSNLGNISSTPVALNFELTGGETPVVLEEPVLALEPREQTTIVFRDLPVVAGGPYVAKATLVGVEADTNADDNEISVTFTVSEG